MAIQFNFQTPILQSLYNKKVEEFKQQRLVEQRRQFDDDLGFRRQKWQEGLNDRDLQRQQWAELMKTMYQQNPDNPATVNGPPQDTVFTNGDDINPGEVFNENSLMNSRDAYNQSQTLGINQYADDKQVYGDDALKQLYLMQKQRDDESENEIIPLSKPYW